MHRVGGNTRSPQSGRRPPPPPLSRSRRSAADKEPPPAGAAPRNRPSPEAASPPGLPLPRRRDTPSLRPAAKPPSTRPNPIQGRPFPSCKSPPGRSPSPFGPAHHGAACSLAGSPRSSPADPPLPASQPGPAAALRRDAGAPAQRRAGHFRHRPWKGGGAFVARPMGARAGMAGRGHVRAGPSLPKAGRELGAAGRKGDGVGGGDAGGRRVGGGHFQPQRARIGRPGLRVPGQETSL